MDVNEFLERIGVGQRLPDDKFFDDSYKTCKIFVRKGVTIIDDEELCHEPLVRDHILPNFFRHHFSRLFLATDNKTIIFFTHTG